MDRLLRQTTDPASSEREGTDAAARPGKTGALRGGLWRRISGYWGWLVGIAVIAIGFGVTPLRNSLFKVVSATSDHISVALFAAPGVIGALIVVVLVNEVVSTRTRERPRVHNALTICLAVDVFVAGWAAAHVFDPARAAPVRPLLIPTVTPPTSAPTPTPSPVDMNPFNMQAGSCFNAPEFRQRDDAPEYVERVSCGTPHDGELFFIGELWPRARRFPGDARSDKETEARCDAEFARYVGIPWQKSFLDEHWWFPSSTTWKNGQHKGACIAAHPKKKLAYSVKGIKR